MQTVVSKVGLRFETCVSRMAFYPGFIHIVEKDVHSFGQPTMVYTQGQNSKLNLILVAKRLEHKD